MRVWSGVGPTPYNRNPRGGRSCLRGIAGPPSCGRCDNCMLHVYPSRRLPACLPTRSPVEHATGGRARLPAPAAAAGVAPGSGRAMLSTA
mmetsp:Transcript_28711/g.84931  ORF Transcript_28711/g.84931 Transcript_28711/m.84931 type:complete len:90 (-) Transcript_28711:121-390(-)|eukprot:365025-Chlamydomonas_euryale.AAC.4